MDRQSNPGATTRRGRGRAPLSQGGMLGGDPASGWLGRVGADHRAADHDAHLAAYLPIARRGLSRACHGPG
jgi:hypothetical protein